MANGLTAKQLACCKQYAKNPTIAGATAAYRAVYKAERSSDETVKREALRLLKHPGVVDFLEAAKARIRNGEVRKVSLTLEEHLDKLAELRDAAVGDGAYAAAISAEKARGQVVGLYVEKQQVQGDVVFSWKVADVVEAGAPD